jgi:hypothetical protein
VLGASSRAVPPTPNFHAPSLRKSAIADLRLNIPISGKPEIGG